MGESANGQIPAQARGGHYKWVALSNTTLGMLAATVNASIVIISLPAIFRGIHLNPLTPGNISYLLWMLMGYLVVSAVLVVTLGRLGDIYGRVRMYNAGLRHLRAGRAGPAVRPDVTGPAGALWLIGFRVIQAVGGAMLMANSPAILTDAFPADQRGTAMGINQVAGHLRPVHRADPRRRARRGRLAAGVHRVGADRRRRHHLVLPEPPGDRHPDPRQDRLAGQRDLRPRPDLAADRHHLRHPALRRPLDGLDQPARADRPHRRARAAGRVLLHRTPGRGTRCSTCSCCRSGRSRPATGPPCSPPSPGAGCSSC